MKEELDYSRGAKPLYAQLHDILLEKLKTGEYKKNDVLPTEAEFEEIFGVSRITARRALAELAAKGLVKRQAGIGTMVISTSEKQEVKARIRLVDGQQQHPIERNNLKLEQLVPPEGVAQAFELHDNSPLPLLTRTIYRQNEQPAQVNYIWLTPRLQNLTLDALKGGLYSMLEGNNENIDSFQDVITAEMPTEDDCRILHIDSHEPLLVKTRKGYNDRGELVEFSIAKHIAHCYQYVVENSR
ncbi:TPA: GntR family transcriptional regulator [Klebsiella aerogenes]|uniref:GntR family transcriptional regulator n=1 Tax=Klebsiella aerogenes TaxID=548 RepID=UPI0007B38393|nr:GntR family transcriptional regulator [Klebsiella aerogenes]KZQ01173.1 GntR family transcriptional regulator [Klebsiella aerogenes]HBT4643865.1 GntR family transcriptional regulator [Klebsiella aerogenes]HCB3607153.1 GntR family transcriptional regulator [Klebsiella aerogenes]HDU5278645.1 GntR family transcriptional regulator [Klebsiella aerogenes]HEM8647532.1 GntR family transcriptional regulator [Klebsiella aerogenes]